MATTIEEDKNILSVEACRNKYGLKAMWNDSEKHCYCISNMSEKEMAQKALEQIGQTEKASVCKMDVFTRDKYIVDKFGNEDERFGTQFGMFPLWSKYVADELLKDKD